LLVKIWAAKEVATDEKNNKSLHPSMGREKIKRIKSAHPSGREDVTDVSRGTGSDQNLPLTKHSDNDFF
jgi:hypothetical protein